MTLVKFKPAHELSHIEKRLKKFFEDFDSPFFGDWGLKSFNSNVFTPRVDVTEDKDNLYVHAEIPGVEKNDVKINSRRRAHNQRRKEIRAKGRKQELLQD